MPQLAWGHECQCSPGVRHWKQCPSCGQLGRPLGWRVTLAERAEGFANATGCLVGFPDWDSPEGAALRARLTICRLCDGEAIIQSANPGEAWAWCPQCKGAGMALDGNSEQHRAMYEEMFDIGRLCDFGRILGDRCTQRLNGALDENELKKLKAQVWPWLPRAALLLPAVRSVDATFIAIGPTQQQIIDQFWRPRTPYASDIFRVRGFIDMERGHFLHSGAAMVRARGAGLVESKATMLQPGWLAYSPMIPIVVVRGSI